MPAALRLEFRALLELYLIPGLTALMPWPLGFRWLRFCSRFAFLYRNEWQAALAQARQFVDVGDETLWARQFRLCRLVDHADLWISRTRTDRWAKKYIANWNSWPELERAPVCILFHWNPGLWLLRAMRSTGASVSSLSAPLARRTMGGAHMGYLYGAIRLSEVIRINKTPIIFAKGAARPSLKALRAGTWLCGLPDVPPGLFDTGEPVVLFGRNARFSSGVLDIARIAKAPVIIMSLGIDLHDGRRQLKIHRIKNPQHPDALQKIAGHWENLLRQNSPGYSLWPAMPAWFTGASDSHE